MLNKKIMVIFLSIVGLGAAGYLYQWLTKKKMEDAEAFYWTTVAEPIAFVSEYAMDKDVVARHAYAVEQLQLHKNPYLKSEDVWLYVYRIHMNLLDSVPAVEQNHSVWQSLVFADIQTKKSKWLATKYGYNAAAAIKTFSNQN